MALKLRTERWGTGERPLLLLHGFTGSAETWRSLEPIFGPYVSAIAVDLPGHGGSPPSQRLGADGFEEALDALEATLDAERVEHAIVLGYSMGARLGLGLTMRSPKRVERLIMESGSPGLLHRRERERRARDDEALAQRIERDGVASFVDAWERLPLFEGIRRLPEAVQDELRTARLSTSAQALATSLRALGTGTQPSYWFELQRLRVPTLLLTGANDLKFTELAQRMTRELPLGWHCALPGVWHVPHLEARTAYAREVLSFLQAPWMETELLPLERSADEDGMIERRSA